MSLLKFISGATACQLCGLPLKTSRFDVKIDGQKVTVCANCKSFINEEITSQENPLNGGENPHVNAELAHSPREFLTWGLVAGLVLCLALAILI